MKRFASLVAAGLFVAAVALLANRSTTVAARHGSHLGGLELVGELSGEEALTEIRRLHALEIPVKDGRVLEYAAGSEKLTVWVAVGGQEADARELLDAMVAKMSDASSNKIFKTPVAVDLATGETIYYTEGLGAHHYFYRKGDKVYWAAVSADTLQREREIVKAVMGGL